MVVVAMPNILLGDEAGSKYLCSDELSMFLSIVLDQLILVFCDVRE
jgi:hypothetical protein